MKEKYKLEATFKFGESKKWQTISHTVELLEGDDYAFWRQITKKIMDDNPDQDIKNLIGKYRCLCAGSEDNINYYDLKTRKLIEL